MATIATPVWVEPAYADRAAVARLVRDRAPHQLMAAAAGYGEMMGGDVSPWFRSSWALDGRPPGGGTLDAEVADLLHHEPFLAAARELYGAEVVRPATLLVNLMGPMAPGVPHVDTPTFRGLPRHAVPVWLLVVMGASGLFERWAVRVAGAITWFYDGPGGELEYWPHGLDGPSEVVAGPFGNGSLMADNDLMPHRVGAIGDPAAFAARARVTAGSWIEPAAGGGAGAWQIGDGAGPTTLLDEFEVRTSILWKALTFPDADAARAFDDHADDLDVAIVVERFTADLAARGVPVDPPADPFTDAAWSRALTSTYLSQAPGPARPG